MATKNDVRAGRTRAKLIAAARTLFARDGYSATGTEAILEGAGVARGALYHHFSDKADLFEAVCRDLSIEAAAAIEAAVDESANPYDSLECGSIAWIEFMAEPEARRILVVEAPGVLGWERWNALDRDLSFRSLQEGIQVASAAGEIRFAAGPEALAIVLNGAMNAIVLRMGTKEDKAGAENLKAGFLELLARLRG